VDLGLKGKFAVVNGASQGIGLAIARALAAEGANILISGRKEAPLVEAADRLHADTGARIEIVTGDIRSADGCAAILEATRRFPGIDMLVNNDGAPPLGKALEFDDLRWSRAVEQNLMSVLRMVRGVVPAMQARGGGSIVNITALSALQPMANFGLSVATWNGVIGLAKTLSIELGSHNIPINTLCPGLIHTPRLDMITGESKASLQDLAADIPLGRIGRPEEIGAIATFLLSPRASYITGVTLPVDGGALRAVH
jgi:3-oxoacyl-[acyl-carrier protein] reductase